MSIAEMLALGASFATCITALVVYLTLREMRKQWRHAHKPVLAPVRQLVYAYPQNGRFYWLMEKNENQGSLRVEPRYEIRLFNLGGGAARNIRTRWELDVQGVVKTLQHLNQANSGSGSNSIELDDSFLKLEASGGGMVVNLEADLENSFDYLMPASVDAQGLAVSLPMSFIVLASEYFVQGYRLPDSRSASSTLGNIPKVSMSLQFYDLFGRRHKSKITFSLNLNYLQSSSGGEVRHFTASLEYETAS